ncbi:MAG: Plug domain-containing protein, partial [Cyclobacteriaceae bacterium]|nr:Plug domain-containing protein [Cyclobacteriaceae bacterium]
MKYFAIVVFLLASMILLKAQSADTLTTKNLSEITIQENRIRVPVSESNRSLQLVKSEQLQSMPVRSLTEALQHVAGVDIRSRGPVGVQADLSIRGSSFDENLVLINGMKMTDPQTGHHLMNLPLSFQDIERVEVLKGA